MITGLRGSVAVVDIVAKVAHNPIIKPEYIPEHRLQIAGKLPFNSNILSGI